MATTNNNLFDNQLETGSLSYLQADGVTPAQLPAGIIPSWVLTDPDNTVTMAVAADGQSAVFTATGNDTSTADAHVVVTAVLADGSSITGDATIHVTKTPTPPPASIVITFGAPSNK